jgi:peptidoglycan hydrolase CwlO-like protein
MKLPATGLIFTLLLGFCAVIVGGCGTYPPCETSLVTMDETRLDAETYEAEVAETDATIADLEQKLDTKNKQIDDIKDKPAEIQEKVDELKKGSGRE